MRIGIDIDGVLTDAEKWQLDFGSKFYYENYGKEIVDHKAYETRNIFNSEEKIDDEFWKENFKEYATNVPVRKFADVIIDKLKGEGNIIYIITARGNFLSHSIGAMSPDENKEVAIDWLNRNKINYDKIFFSRESKLKICLDNGIDVMIEDKPQNITEISKSIPVICFNAGYNEKCSGKNITRCYSWYDIYAKINKLKNKL